MFTITAQYANGNTITYTTDNPFTNGTMDRGNITILAVTMN